MPTAENMPLTIARLMNLRPNQTITYYKGNFPADWTRCERNPDRPRDGEAPNYATLLKKIRRYASLLSTTGHISLNEEIIVGQGGRVQYIAYIATGTNSQTSAEKPSPNF